MKSHVNVEPETSHAADLENAVSEKSHATDLESEALGTDHVKSHVNAAPETSHAADPENAASGTDLKIFSNHERN